MLLILRLEDWVSQIVVFADFWISDVPDIKHVINYDFPNTVEDYVHRIGRTGRQDKKVNRSICKYIFKIIFKGTSYTFLTMKDEHRVGDLIRVMEKAGQEIPEELRNMRYGGRM